MTSGREEIRLRDARVEDSQVIARLLGELGYPTDPVQVPGRMKAVLAEGGAVMLAVDANDAVLGLMCLARHSALHVSSPVAYITALVTAPEARRRGVGRLLVEEAKGWALSMGCIRLTLTSAEHRTDAHEFYPSCGLPYTGRRFATAIPA
jgi:GNAT superfamily N-acetyltransferase